MPEGSDYVVIARKWRPRTFDEVVGQEHVTTTLKNALEAGHLAHAYLFTGPRGVGKTTVARILAKALNCINAPTLTPCNECSACKEINQGTSMDVIEIDGASNRGIDEIRNLRESVRYASVGGKKKVYIIDEVHMLTQEAFNALLKTLEEPPPHVVFIFATTQPLKVPSTIVSRCQRFDFRRISAESIAARLSEICETEGYKCDQAALMIMAQRADGSMRDAQSMLEQVLAFSGGTATEEDVGAIAGLRGSDLVAGIAKAIIAGDESKVLDLVADAFDAGADSLDLISSLIEWLRFLLVAAVDPSSSQLLSLGTELRRRLVADVEGVPSEHLLAMVTMIADAENMIRRATHKRYLLEALLLRMSKLRGLTKISEIIAKIKNSDTSGSSNTPSNPNPAEVKRRENRDELEKFEDLTSGWRNIIEDLRNTRASLASVLDLCDPPRVSDGIYWLEVPSAFHESQILKKHNLRVLTEHLRKLTNSSVVIKTRVKRDKSRTTKDLTEAASKEPLVRMLIENLGGKIVEIRQLNQQSHGEEVL